MTSNAACGSGVVVCSGGGGSGMLNITLFTVPSALSSLSVEVAMDVNVDVGADLNVDGNAESGCKCGHGVWT
jgi:hypothetical protein